MSDCVSKKILIGLVIFSLVLWLLKAAYSMMTPTVVVPPKSTSNFRGSMRPFDAPYNGVHDDHYNEYFQTQAQTQNVYVKLVDLTIPLTNVTTTNNGTAIITLPITYSKLRGNIVELKIPVTTPNSSNESITLMVRPTAMNAKNASFVVPAASLNTTTNAASPGTPSVSITMPVASTPSTATLPLSTNPVSNVAPGISVTSAPTEYFTSELDTANFCLNGLGKINV